MVIHFQFFLRNHLKFIGISLLPLLLQNFKIKFFSILHIRIQLRFGFYFGFHLNISFLFFSIVLHLLSHLFCWQTHANSEIVVILSIVQIIHNSKDKSCFICELSKCVLLSKLLKKTLTGTIFDFLTMQDMHLCYQDQKTEFFF